MPKFDIKFQGFWHQIPPNLIESDNPHFPQLYDNKDFIGYLECSDEADQYEWSHDISTTNSCGDIIDTQLPLITPYKTIYIKRIQKI